ncbi:hypothetical protein [Alicyclobacillus fastidiosus]|uniref:Uncharacterized protein n=1 Tax=Alicyclobacillus fastidiosus TaxID=392011 RepID=A0ABV5AJP0_9BACL|nr:hypothetical protein [Alicyclobacillus fastidiosus]WEH10040.1 hypothetical protein PYS47_01740 [Alicyclobacillus fastidiosus]
MKIRRILLYILVPIVILVGVGSVIAAPSLRHRLVNLVQLQTVKDVQVYVHSLGTWGPIIVILLMVLHSVTFVPSEVVTITEMLGAYLAFFLARWFGRPLVNRFVPASSHRSLINSWWTGAYQGFLYCASFHWCPSIPSITPQV